jgi:Flp pilus assembly pilin Flp
LQLALRIAREMAADERGQAGVEYILLLAGSAALLLLTVKKLIRPAFATLGKFMDSKIGAKFFGGNLHYYSVKR